MCVCVCVRVCGPGARPRRWRPRPRPAMTTLATLDSRCRLAPTLCFCASSAKWLCFLRNVRQIGGDTASRADRPRCSLERFGAGMGGWSGRFPWAAQRGLLGAFPSIFIFSCRPRGHAVRFRGRRSAIFLLFSVGPLHLVVFSLGWTRVLNLWRTGPRLPSRPPFPLMAGVGPVPAAAGAVPCCAGIAAGQRACACVRGADA